MRRQAYPDRMNRHAWILVGCAVVALVVLDTVFHVRVFVARGKLLLGVLVILGLVVLLWPRQPPPSS